VAIDYDFGERLAMSHGVSQNKDIRRLILDNIPGALDVHPAHLENDRNGTDWWVEHITGRWLSVDCKVRESDWWATHPEEDDLALETWSVVESKVPGWTRDSRKRTDYVLWLWTDTGRWCLVPFAMLCKVFTDQWQTWSNKYRIAKQKTTRDNGSAYHSECVFVPRREVWVAIYLAFGGNKGDKVER